MRRRGPISVSGTITLLCLLLATPPPHVFPHDIWGPEGNPVPHEHQWEEGEYVPQEILVYFLPETIALPEGQTKASIGDIVMHPEIEPFLLASGASTFEELRFGWFLVWFSDPIDVSEIVAAFSAEPRVLVSEPNLRYRTTCTRAASWGVIKAVQRGR